MFPPGQRLTPETRHHRYDDYCNLFARQNTNTEVLMPGYML